MRKLVTSFAAFIMMALTVQAQQITGVVKDEKGKGLEKANISLLRSKDSSVVKIVATGDNGAYSISTAQPGSYLVSATYVGYAPAYSQVFELPASGNVTVPEIAIAKIKGDLKEVTITAKKPIVEVKADKTILNVEGTINAVGYDALELLRRSPGVMIDKDDNVSLAGKNGVQVFIDGKPSPLAGSDLANYLKSLQSAQIEAIEIITNPSAKYEAAGNAGIINIKLGDIVYVEVETIGKELEAGAVFGTVEAVKTVSDLFLPVSGTIIELNPNLAGVPESVNNDPYGEGWMVKMTVNNPADVEALLDAAAYEAVVG